MQQQLRHHAAASPTGHATPNPAAAKAPPKTAPMKQIINLLSAAKNTKRCILQLCQGCHDYIASVLIVLELTLIYSVRILKW